MKSVPYNIAEYDKDIIVIQGEKKRIFFDYDMESFLQEVDR